ncbi:hypothetical protein [Sphingomonas adhaesiva]|uniref:hypothetical protein n=1 Tax=Sphingomonas adhaesiva TaxID=28212 RepID=UPI002FFBBFD9
MMAGAEPMRLTVGQDAGSDRLRFVARFINALVLDRLTRWPAALGVDAADALLVQMTRALSLPALRTTGPAAPQPIAVPLAAMAQASGLSYETARRRAARLRVAGLLQQRDDGFLVPPAVTLLGAGAAEVEKDRTALLTMLVTMEAQGLRIATAARAAQEGDPARVSRLDLDVTTRWIEEVVAFDDGVVPAMIRLAIAHANTRHLLDDPALSLRYAHQHRPLPDDARRPTGPRAIARDTRLPFETVRRHVAALLAAGTLSHAGGGVILPARELMSERHVEHQRRLIAPFRRLLDELAALGAEKGATSGSDAPN